MLDTQGPQQWPLREGQPRARNASTPTDASPRPTAARAFAAVSMQPLAEPRDAHYPFSLNTGRLRDHWHGLSRTGTLGRLYGHAGEPGSNCTPATWPVCSCSEGDLVQVQSRRGRLVLPAMASTQVAPAQAFIAMHWGDEVLGGLHRGGVNALTSPACCPQSKQPELKHAAVKIIKATLPWQLLARAWLPSHLALQRHAELLAACAAWTTPPACPSAASRVGSACGCVPPRRAHRPRPGSRSRSAARPGPRRGAALRRPAARPAALRAAGGARDR